MAKCKLCENPNAKYLLENARHLTGEKVCLDCYQTFNDDTNQTYLFQKDDKTPMSYEQFLEIYPKLGYTKIADFAKEIGISSNTPSTTWKKKGEVPYLVKFFLLTKLNNIESKEKTVYIESTQNVSQELELSDEELIQTVYALKKGIFYMFARRHNPWVKRESATKETLAFNRKKVRAMIRYIKRLNKYYDINNRPELELIHSTFIKYTDFHKFFGKNIERKTQIIKNVDDSFRKGRIWTTRQKGVWLGFQGMCTPFSYVDLLRYAR